MRLDGIGFQLHYYDEGIGLFMAIHVFWEGQVHPSGGVRMMEWRGGLAAERKEMGCAKVRKT